MRSSATANRLRVSARVAGFTLVELVIALALVGLITLLLFSGLRLGTRSWEGVSTLVEKTAGPRIAHSFLAGALTQIRSPRVTFDGEEVLVFGGDAENLEFVAPLSSYVGTPGLYILRLNLDEGEEDRLVLTRWLLHPDVLNGFGGVPEWTPFDGGARQSSAGPLDEDLAIGAFGSTLLLDDVDEFEIGYFGIAEGEQEPDWHSEWLGEDQMPLALRIHLTTKGHTWPDMLFRLPEFEPPGSGVAIGGGSR